MSDAARLGRHFARVAVLALFLTLGSQLLAPTITASAQRPTLDVRSLALLPTDLPAGFGVVAAETTSEALRDGQGRTDADVVGSLFRTVLERPPTQENLETGPIRVAQVIARSDDPTRAAFSLDAQREFNVREHGFEVVEGVGAADDLLYLIRRTPPFVEYRIVAVRRSDTLISTTLSGLSSAMTQESVTTLVRVSLARYDEAATGLVATQQLQPSPAGNVNADLRAVQTPTPVPVPSLPLLPALPTATPKAAPAPRSTAKVRLPDDFDDRLAQPWSELMATTAKAKSGGSLRDMLLRIVDTSAVNVKIGDLRPNVGGELKSIAKVDGVEVKVVKSEITVNKDVMNESPRVLAAILAHEIVHAGQPIKRSNGEFLDCLEAEVEAYAVQAQVWGAFWGDEHRPGQTKWERSMGYVEEAWKAGGDRSLRTLIREETGQDSHSCVD